MSDLKFQEKENLEKFSGQSSLPASRGERAFGEGLAVPSHRGERTFGEGSTFPSPRKAGRGLGGGVLKVND